jgi:hypothetical protein
LLGGRERGGTFPLVRSGGDECGGGVSRLFLCRSERFGSFARFAL